MCFLGIGVISAFMLATLLLEALGLHSYTRTLYVGYAYASVLFVS